VTSCCYDMSTKDHAALYAHNALRYGCSIAL